MISLSKCELPIASVNGKRGLPIQQAADNCRNNKPGKKGYPRFKHNTRSVEYKVSGWKLSKYPLGYRSADRKRITFTDQKNIGTLKLIGSRDIYFYQPEQIKRVRILRRADGYYIQFSIKLDPRDTVKPIPPGATRNRN